MSKRFPPASRRLIDGPLTGAAYPDDSETKLH